MTSPVDGQVVPVGTDTQTTIHWPGVVLLKASERGLLPLRDQRRSVWLPRGLSE